MSSDPSFDTLGQPPQAPTLTPEEAQQRAAQSHRMAAAFGEIVSVLMRSAPYRNATLAQIERLVVPAVLTGQFSLAEAQSKESGFMAPVGVVLWASVDTPSETVLSSAPDAYQRLTPQEWKSGDVVWLIDAVGDSRVIGAMLKHLHQTTWSSRVVKAHMKGEDGVTAVRTLTAPA